MCPTRREVSVLFNEPKLLKFSSSSLLLSPVSGFSALQRAEIAEIEGTNPTEAVINCFSALQRAEIAERRCRAGLARRSGGFSALQRAEIAESRGDVGWRY